MSIIIGPVNVFKFFDFHFKVPYSIPIIRTCKFEIVHVAEAGWQMLDFHGKPSSRYWFQLHVTMANIQNPKNPHSMLPNPAMRPLSGSWKCSVVQAMR